MNARLTLTAAALLIAATAGGVGLGGYTVGGFHFGTEPASLHDMTAAQTVADATGSEVVAPPIGLSSEDHVCTGCDARLVHEREWAPYDAAYDDHDREGGWRPKAASEEDGWVVDEYASAQNERHSPAARSDGDDNAARDMPVLAASPVRVSDGADTRLPLLGPTGI